MTQPPRREHRRGIYPRLLSSYDTVDGDAWRDAIETRQHVGTCNRDGCGQPLRPLPPYLKGPVTWYPAECTSAGCDNEVAAHGPRPEKNAKGGA